jgi:hypothetical protein
MQASISGLCAAIGLQADNMKALTRITAMTDLWDTLRHRSFAAAPRYRACAYLAGVFRVLLAVALLVTFGLVSIADAQEPGGWSSDLNVNPAASPRAPKTDGAGGTTVIKKKPSEAPVPAEVSKVRLIALLTADGQRIDQDLTWRVFEEATEPRTSGKLISKHTEAAPVLTLKPGTYTINAAFGRANLTRKITVSAGVEATEPFVLNAGGLRVRLAPVAGGMEGMKSSYDIMTDERDQRGDRRIVLVHAKPDTVIRLNSGIYHVVSTLGDANATVEADVTVEAGKLTEATISHKAGRVTLKLVTREGGEALPDTEWNVLTTDGQTIKKSVGALPTHILAPGKYLAVAKSQGRIFRREFDVSNGQSIQVEVMRQ